MRTTQTDSRPTAKQLSYLRSLAMRTATTFTYPSTRSEASRQIQRLKALKAAGRPLPSERDIDLSALYAPGVQADEIAGHGSASRWAHHTADGEEKVVARTVAPKVELARYTVGESERVIYGQRIGGRAHVMDRPADGEGRSYVIERDVHLDGRAALDALIVDYTEQAKQADAVPMASSVLARELQAAA